MVLLKTTINLKFD